MTNTLEICISYLPTGTCTDCDENLPDVKFTIDLPDSYQGDDKYAKYIKDNFNSILDIADNLIITNYEELLNKKEKQEWFALFLRPNRWDLRKLRVIYGLDIHDHTKRLCKKIHSGTNILDRFEVESLIAPIWVGDLENVKSSDK